MTLEPKFKRCIYVASNGFECETWFEGLGELCPVHRGSISAPLAANGTNRDPYIETRNKEILNLANEIRGRSESEALDFLNTHIATIEQEIEKLKIKALTARAKESEILQGMSEEERKARRLIRTPKVQRAEKRNVGKELGKALIEREKAIKSMMALGHSREKAILLIEMD